MHCRTYDVWTCIIISLCTFVVCTRTSVLFFLFPLPYKILFGVRPSTAQAFSLRPIAAKAMVRLQASNARFVVDEVELVQGSFLVLRFSLSVSLCQCPIPIYLLGSDCCLIMVTDRIVKDSRRRKYMVDIRNPYKAIHKSYAFKFLTM